MTKFGETHGFKAKDFVTKLEDHLGRKIDGIICNTRRPSQSLLKKYLNQKADFVELNKSALWLDGRDIYDGDFLNTSAETVRHDPRKLKLLIKKLISQENDIILP